MTSLASLMSGRWAAASRAAAAAWALEVGSPVRKLISWGLRGPYRISTYLGILRAVGLPHSCSILSEKGNPVSLQAWRQSDQGFALSEIQRRDLAAHLEAPDLGLSNNNMGVSQN